MPIKSGITNQSPITVIRSASRARVPAQTRARVCSSLCDAPPRLNCKVLHAVLQCRTCRTHQCCAAPAMNGLTGGAEQKGQCSQSSKGIWQTNQVHGMQLPSGADQWRRSGTEWSSQGGDLERTSMLTAAPQVEAAARKNAIPAGLTDRRSQCAWQRAQALPPGESLPQRSLRLSLLALFSGERLL